MEIAVKSITPQGVDVVNGSSSSANFFDIKNIERTIRTDGLIDRNRIIELSDICIMHVLIDAEEETEFHITTDSPVISMDFYLSSPTNYILEETGNIFAFDSGSHNIFYLPNTTIKNKWFPGNSQELLSIALNLSYIGRYFPEKEIFLDFVKAIERNYPAALSSRNMPISHKMRNVIRDLLNENVESHLMRLHFENKVFELLLLQMEQFSIFADTKHRFYVDKKLKEKLFQAKDIIEFNMVRPLTITNLAKEVATNEYYLKRGFKQLFGKTVFSYSMDLRMKKAKDLLIVDGLNVNEVAFFLGYKDATNFSAAFKKFYGFTPTKLNP
jgi:AraC-like DNA-binding protein